MNFTLGLPEIIAIMTPITGCIALLFRELLKSKDAQIADLKAQLAKVDQDKDRAIDGWVKTLSTSQTVAKAATQAIDIAERRSDS